VIKSRALGDAVYRWHLNLVADNLDVFVDSATVALEFTAMALGMATIPGLPIAIARLSQFRVLAAPAAFHIETFRITPALVQLIWIRYTLPLIRGIRLNGFQSAPRGHGLPTSGHFSEIFRGWIQSIELGQIDADRVMAMTYRWPMRRIILPEMLQQIIFAFNERGHTRGSYT
jgi:polar amino acid transport system permease protein